MATQQLPTQLPSGWESNYDSTSERWFFLHRPTGFSQFFFPKAGDENTRIAELAQPQPMNASVTVKMEAMSISEDSNAAVPRPQPVAVQTTQPSNQQARPGQFTPPVQSTPTSQSSPIGQQSSNQGSPLARTVSGSVQRKAIPRRDSVQSQASTASSRTAGQPTQQYQAVAPQTQSNNAPHIQNSQLVQQYQQPQVVQHTGSMQSVPLQTQPTVIYYPNNQPQQAPQPLIQPQYAAQQAGLPVQSQVHPSTTQNVQYQQVQPLQVVTGQPVQQVYQSSPQSPQAFTQSNQIYVHSGKAPIQQVQSVNSQFQVQYSNPQQQQQIMNTQIQPQFSNLQQQHVTSPQLQPQYSNSPQQIMNPQIQPQHGEPQNSNQISSQDSATSQRRFSTIPLSQQANNGQIPSPAPQINRPQAARHSSIGTGNYQSQPLIQQMQSVPGQPGQFISAPQNFPSQVPPQAGATVQSSPAVQYIQQNVAPLPPTLPPPAPGMQWVLVQPGNQRPQPAQIVQSPNQSPQYSVQMQQFGGVQVAGPTGRPGLVTRLSSSTVSSSKKAFDASKGFVKKHPGKTMALVGGLGVVAEACGVNVLSDAVAGSKIYANVQNAKARKKALHAATPTAAHSTIGQVPQAVHHNTNGPGVQYVTPQATIHAPQISHQQSVAPHFSQGGHMNSQPMFAPVHQHTPHQQFIPATPQQHHQAHHLPHFFNQQNQQSTDPFAQFNQNQNTQYQYNGQQPPVQYYQPADASYQDQQLDPSQMYQTQQDNSGQNDQGNSGGVVSDAYNILTSGQGNPPSQPQSPAPSAGNQSPVPQPQLPTPSASPFDPSQQLQQSPNISPSLSSFDPSTQLQQFPTPSTSPFDPLLQLQQQILQDQASTQISNQAINISQQFTNDLLGQSALNPLIQNENSYINPPSPSQQFGPGQFLLNTSIQNDISNIISPSPTQGFTPNLPGQDMLNTLTLNDNSYISAPPSPTLTDGGNSCGDYDALSQGFADQDSAIF